MRCMSKESVRVRSDRSPTVTLLLLLLWFWQYSLTASALRRRLRPVKHRYVPGDALSDLPVAAHGFIGAPF